MPRFVTLIAWPAVQHKLARDAAAVRERQLDAEISMLRGQLASATAAARCPPASADETSAEAACARRDLARTQRALLDLEDTLVDTRAANARLERERTALREQLAAQPPGGGDAAAPPSAEQLRRLLEAQKERDAAQQDAAAARRAAERATLEHGVALQHANGELEAARSAAAAQAAVVSNAKAEAATYQRQLESVKRELAVVKGAKRASDDELRAARTKARAARSAEVQACPPDPCTTHANS